MKKWLKSALKWLKTHLSDKWFRRIFYVVVIVLYSDVWIPLLISLIVGIHSSLSHWLIAFASVCAGIWASPLLPFFPIALGITEFFYAVVFKRENGH